MSPLERDTEDEIRSFAPSGDVIGVVVTGPRRVECPVCQVKPGEPCTQPTDTTRKPVAWFHSRREQAATRY